MGNDPFSDIVQETPQNIQGNNQSDPFSDIVSSSPKNAESLLQKTFKGLGMVGNSLMKNANQGNPWNFASVPTSDYGGIATQGIMGLMQNLPENILARPTQSIGLGALMGPSAPQYLAGAGQGEDMANATKGFLGQLGIDAGQLTHNFKPELNTSSLHPKSPQAQGYASQANMLGSTAGISSIIPTINSAESGAKSISNLFDVTGAKGELSDLAQDTASNFGNLNKQATQKGNADFGEGIGKIEDTGLNQETAINQALRNTADVIDPTKTTHNQPGSLANYVLSKIEQVNPEVEHATGLTQDIPSMTGPQLQAKIKDIANSLGHPVAKNEFWTQVSKLLPDSMKDIKSARENIYNNVEAARPLEKVGTLRQIAQGKGKIGPSTLEDLRTAAKGVGDTNSIDDLIKAGNRVSKTQATRSLAKFAGKAGEWTGIGALLHKIFK